MKRKISVCIIVIMVLVLSGILFAGQPKENTEAEGATSESEERPKLIEVSARQEAFAYILREADGMVVVHLADGALYMETGIALKSLPEELADRLRAGGIGVESEEELFDFLENYSS